ncbi:MAG: hypothetical protein P9C55_01480 [Defluviicoccus sp.]|nr:hypothetical protein [Defluviicoccus sp.]
MMDHLSLDQLRHAPPGQVAAQPIEVLSALAAGIAETKSLVAEAEARLNAGLDLRFSARAAAARAEAGKQAGTVRFDDGDFVIVADLPKRVKWDQSRLAEAMEIIRRDWNDDPAQYVRIELKVAETAYGSWPAAIRRLFEPARTLQIGRPGYRIEPARAEAA